MSEQQEKNQESQEIVKVEAEVVSPGERALQKRLTEDDIVAIDLAIMQGDYGKLKPEQRLNLIYQKCRSLGVNIIHQPFVWGTVQNKLVPIPTKNLSEQLRANRGIDIQIAEEKLDKDRGIYWVRVKAIERTTGRSDEDMGVVGVGVLEGDLLANRIMTCITKAKNRVTKSICGVGGTDETEAESLKQLQEEPRVINPQPQQQPQFPPQPQRPTTTVPSSEEVQARPVEAELVEPKPQPSAAPPPPQASPSKPTNPPAVGRPPMPRPAGLAGGPPRPATKAPPVPFPPRKN